MKSVAGTLVPLVLVALLAMVTFWLERVVKQEDPALKAALRHDPDYIINQIKVRQFGIGGTLQRSLLADSMTHYPDDDSTHVVNPHLTYFPGQQTTQVFASTAQVTRDNKEVRLRGNVRLIKPPLEAIPATELRTEALTVFPDEDIAKGNVRVTITRGKSVVSGDSIDYNGRTSIAILAGRVKGTFYRVKKS